MKTKNLKLGQIVKIIDIYGVEKVGFINLIDEIGIQINKIKYKKEFSFFYLFFYSFCNYWIDFRQIKDLKFLK